MVENDSIATLLDILLSVDEPPGPSGSFFYVIVGMEQHHMEAAVEMYTESRPVPMKQTSESPAFLAL